MNFIDHCLKQKRPCARKQISCKDFFVLLQYMLHSFLLFYFRYWLDYPYYKNTKEVRSTVSLVLSRLRTLYDNKQNVLTCRADAQLPRFVVINNRKKNDSITMLHSSYQLPRLNVNRYARCWPLDVQMHLLFC